jgi:tetratricopeptide (TPR) repeat protein
VFGMLAMRAGRAVSRSELIDGLWGDEPPSSAVNSVHVYVAGLRRVLEPRRASRAPGQVRPLLPGTPSCFVLVTSRDSLTGLVARHGARRLGLDPLPPTDAVTLLRALIGGRVDADPAAAGTLAGQCARLPLALRVAAEFAVGRPDLTLAELTGALAAEHRRLDLLDAGGDPRTAVRAVLSWSYRHLPPAAAQAFRLAGLHPAAELSTSAAAALFGSSAGHAAGLLGQLCRAHLVHRAGPGRYAMHDLLRAYAASLTVPGDPDDPAAPDGPGERGPALTRLLDYYLGAAAAAMDVLFPAERHRRPQVARPEPLAPALDSPAAARAWLDAEREALLAVTAHAAACGWPGHATQLSGTLSRYLETGGHYAEAAAVHTQARRAAQLAGDRAAEAHALNSLGIVSGRLGRYQQGAGYLREALAMFRELDDHTGAARALGNLGSGEWRQGRYTEAARYHHQSLALFRQAGDELGEARALTDLGTLACRRGRYPEAASYHRRALGLFRDIGERVGEAEALNGLGEVLLAMGQPSRARAQHAAALELATEIGDPHEQARARNGLAAAAEPA